MFHALLLQVEQEEQRTDAFVAVGERVVLDDEVEQVGRFLLPGPVEDSPNMVCVARCAYPRIELLSNP